MKEIFGGLLEFESKGKLDEFINGMDPPMSLKIIELALEYGVQQGLFNLDENYCLYMALEKLKDNSEKN